MGENGLNEKESLRKLFVGGISLSTTDDAFKSHFSQYGMITDSVIIRDPQTKKSKGFGFVTYDSIAATDAALAGRPHNIDNREVEIKRAIPRDDQSGTGHIRAKKIFMGGLSTEATEADITTYIEGKYAGRGSVVKVDLITDKETGKKKGFGFLDLDSEDFADYIVIDEPRPTLCGKKCELKKAAPKDGSQGGRGGGRGGRGGRGGARGGRGGGGGGFGGGYGQSNFGGGYGNSGYSNTGYGMTGYGGMTGGGYGGYGDLYGQGYGTYGAAAGYGAAGGYGGYQTGYGDYGGASAYGTYGAGGGGQYGQKPGRGAGRYKPY